MVPSTCLWRWVLGVSVTVTAAGGFHGDTRALRSQTPRRQAEKVFMVEPEGYRQDTAGYRQDTAGYRQDTAGYRQDTGVPSSGKTIISTVVLASLVISTSLVFCVWFGTRLQRSKRLRLNVSLPKLQFFRRWMAGCRGSRQDTGDDDDDDDDSSFYTDVALSPDACLTQAVVSPACGTASVSGGPDYTDVVFPGVCDYTEVTLSAGPHYADVDVVSGSRDSDTAAAVLFSKGSRVEGSRAVFVKDYSEVKVLSSDRVAISGRPEYSEVYKPHPGARVVMLDDRQYTEVDVLPVNGRVLVPSASDYTDVAVSSGDDQMLMSGGHEYVDVQLSNTDNQREMWGSHDYTEVFVPPEDGRVVISGALENPGVGLLRAVAGVDVPEDLHYAETCVTDVRTGGASQGLDQYSHLENCAPRSTLKGVARAYNHVVVVRPRHDDVGQAAGLVKLTSVSDYDVSSVTSDGCRVKVIAQQYDTLNKQFPRSPANT